ncbi:GNAT family N-acetyltransferase [Kribbella deserti]|uniref:GNAT family N-acetyltransferase n=1 Tax=Kribbella deserti TaxID=1926257 RepID=A0ABV6QJD3_9ACTN
MTTTGLSVSDRYADQDRRWFPPLVFLEREEHRELIHRLRNEAEEWVASKGLDQYTAGPNSKSEFAHSDIDRLFDAGQFVGIAPHDQVVAVVAVTEPDADFWTPEEIAEPQGYLSRFLVAEHGKHYGANLLSAVKTAEMRRGSRWLRLDVWRTNTALHAYYMRQGFKHVRTEVVPGRMSGALFQMDLHGGGKVEDYDMPKA